MIKHKLRLSIFFSSVILLPIFLENEKGFLESNKSKAIFPIINVAIPVNNDSPIKDIILGYSSDGGSIKLTLFTV